MPRAPAMHVYWSIEIIRLGTSTQSQCEIVQHFGRMPESPTTGEMIR